jgi:hypothetical protein
MKEEIVILETFKVGEVEIEYVLWSDDLRNIKAEAMGGAFTYLVAPTDTIKGVIEQASFTLISEEPREPFPRQLKRQVWQRETDSPIDLEAAGLFWVDKASRSHYPIDGPPPRSTHFRKFE